MSVVEFPLNDQRIAEAVNTLNRMGPEAVAQAALKYIEEHHLDSFHVDPPPKSKLYLVRMEDESS